MMPIRPLPRRRQLLALEPRLLLDAAAAATAAKVADASDTGAARTDTTAVADAAVAVAVAPTATAPGLTATGNEQAIGIDDTSGTQAVDLFSDVSVSLDSGGNELTDLVITVDRSGANQALVIDGTTIVLQNTDLPGTTANNFYSYQVSSSGGSTTITLSIASSEAYAPADVATLIDGMQYSTLDTSVESGAVTVTLVSLSDDSDTAAVGIDAKVAVTSNINVAPELSDDHALTPAETITTDGLGSQVEVAYSSDGKFAYAAGNGVVNAYAVNPNGSLSALSSLTVEGLGNTTQLAISADGRSLYALDGGSAIHHVSIGSDGSLGDASTVDTGNGEANGGLAISDDGAYVYVGTAYNDVAIFARDSGSGELTFVSRGGGGNGDGRSGVIATSGNYVYVSYIGTTEDLTVYQRNADGTFSQLATLTTSDDTNYSAVDYQIEVSADGRYIYVGDPNDGSLSVYRFSATDNTLVQVDSHELTNITGQALSDDGSVLYVSTAEGIDTYRIASDGSLKLTSSIATVGSSDLALSSDGLSLLLAGSNGLSRYSLAQTLPRGESTTFADGLTLADSNNAVLDDGNGNYNGTRLSVSADVAGGSFGFVDGNDLVYDSASGNILYQGSAIASYNVDASGVLSVRFSADTSTAVANQVLRQLSYRNDSAAAGSYVTLSVQANDGALSSTPVELLLRVNSAPQLDDSVAESYTLPSATSETRYSHTLDAGLFSDADGDSLTWSISGLPEGLVFDAATRTISGDALVAGSFSLTISVSDPSGSSASHTLDLVVEQIANRAPSLDPATDTTLDAAIIGESYSVSLDGWFNDADSRYGDTLSLSIAGLPEGLSYDAATQTIRGSSSALGDYRLTVTATDESGASVSTTLTLRVITQAEADNTAPVLQPETSTLHYSSDGTLSGFSQYVNDLELSADGRTLTIAASSSQNAGGSSYLYVYSRDTETGKLTLLQTFVQGSVDDNDASNGIEVDGLQGVTSFNYAADGKSLYVTGYTSSGSAAAYSIVAFSVADDGSLSATGSSLALTQKVLQVSVADDGKTLYAMSSDSVHAVSIDAQGQLSLLASYQPGEGYLSLGTANSMQLDDDGSLYVLGGSRLTVYTRADDGSLSLAGQLSRNGSTLTWTDASGVGEVVTTLENSNAFSGANALAVGNDGLIHLTTSNGFLTTLRFTADDNSLSFVSAVDAYTPLGQFPHGLAISADGSTLYVSSASSTVLVIYSVAEDGKPSFSHTVETGGGVSRLVVSADGQFLYGGKNLYFGTLALSQISADGVTLDYDPQKISTPLQSLTLSDAEFDALDEGNGNYQGTSLTLQRSEGAVADDQFGFVDGNGLSLVDGQILLDGKAIASFSSAGGVLSLSFTAAVSSATANQVLDQISYHNASAAPGQTLGLSLRVSDQYGQSDQLAISLSVLDVNDAPSATATSSTSTYISQGNTVRIFENAEVSTGDDNQTITRLSLTIDGLQDGVAERLMIGDGFVNLSDGISNTIWFTLDDGTSTSVDVSVTVVDGRASVELTNDQGWSAETTAALIELLGYSNNSTDYGNPLTEGTRTFTLTSISDSGGTDNGGVDTSTLAITSLINVQQNNTLPTLQASGLDLDYTTGAAAGRLFADVSIDTGESGQTITGINFSVSGLLDAEHEQLIIDGSTIALVSGASGSTASGMDYWIEVDDNGNATVYLSNSTGISVSAAQTLVSEIAYQNTSSVPSDGARSVTISGISDSGGYEYGEPNTRANISVDNGINDAPQLQGEGANSSTTGAAVELFSNVSISTGEADQTLIRLTVQISGLQDGDDETLHVDGSAIALGSAHSGTTPSGYTYEVAWTDGQATVTLTLGSAGLSTNATETLIAEMSYANASVDATPGARAITLSGLQDSGGTTDGGQDTATSTLSARVTVLEFNNAPSLSSTPAQTTYIENQGAVTLFSNTRIDTVEAGQNLLQLQLSVSGLTDGGNEILYIDGSAIALIEGASGTTRSGYEYSVSVHDGIAEVSLGFGSAGIDADSAAAAVDGIAYANTSDTPGGTARSISLVALQDSGGSDNGGSDRSSLALTANVQIDAVNDAPQPSGDEASLPALVPGSPYQTTLPETWFADADGDALTWSVSGLPDGLVFDPATRGISGTLGADASSSYALTISVTDPAGVSASRSVSLSVEATVTPTLLPVTFEPLDLTPVGASPIPADVFASAPTSSLDATLSAPDFDAAGTVGEPFGYASLRSSAAQLLDALTSTPQQASLREPLPLRFADGRSSPLVTLAADGAAPAARSTFISGRWSYDPAGHRLLYPLPDGLFSSDRAVASVSLRDATGHAPPGVSLDLDRGQLIARTDRGVRELQLVLRTVDGQHVVVVIQLDPAAHPRRHSEPATDLRSEPGKPDIADLLRRHAASDLLTQAHTLLARLGEPDTHTSTGRAAASDSHPSSNLATRP